MVIRIPPDHAGDGRHVLRPLTPSRRWMYSDLSLENAALKDVIAKKKL
jgi:hypothetical protein